MEKLYLNKVISFLNKLISEETKVVISSQFDFEKEAQGTFLRKEGHFYLKYNYDVTVNDSVLPIDEEISESHKKYFSNQEFSFEIIKTKYSGARNTEFKHRLTFFKSKSFKYDLNQNIRSVSLLEEYFNLSEYIVPSKTVQTDYNNIKVDYFRIEIESYNFYLYNFRPKHKLNFLVFETPDKISFQKFFKIRNSVFISLGFVSGHFFNREEFIFSDYENQINFHYEWKQRDAISYLYPIDSTIFPPSNKPSKLDSYESIMRSFGVQGGLLSDVQPEEFFKVFTLLYQNRELQTAMMLYFESRKSSLLLQPIGLFAVLEIIAFTVENKFISTTKNKKYLAKDRAKDILFKYRDSIIIEDFDELNTTLDLLGKKQNSRMFLQAFDRFNIKLTLEEQKILNKRNDFFHGKVTIENENFSRIKSDEGYFQELNYISLKLTILIFKLIRGMAGVAFKVKEV